MNGSRVTGSSRNIASITVNVSEGMAEIPYQRGDRCSPQ
jgi:hypothetical protein